MSNFTKLFLYAFATGMGMFRDSRGALRRIDEILETDEEILWQELKQSIEDAKIQNGLKDVGVDVSDPNCITEPLTPEQEEKLTELLKIPSIEMLELKKAVQKVINARNK